MQHRRYRRGKNYSHHWKDPQSFLLLRQDLGYCYFAPNLHNFEKQLSQRHCSIRPNQYLDSSGKLDLYQMH